MTKEEKTRKERKVCNREKKKEIREIQGQKKKTKTISKKKKKKEIINSQFHT